MDTSQNSWYRDRNVFLVKTPKSDQQARAVAKYSNISVDCARRKVLLIHVP